MSKVPIKIFFILLLCYCSENAQSQKIPTDTVWVKGRSFLILGDSSIFIPKDTTIYLPDSIASKLKLDNKPRSEAFYQNIKEKFYKRKFTKELYDLIFKDVNRKRKKVVPSIVNTDFKVYNGLIINDLKIKKLSPFGTSIHDTLRQSDDWIIKTANSLHVKTQDRIIRNNVFFKKGDKFEASLITDSERVLRLLPFIRDARIYVVQNENGSVDILILTKDVWSLTVDFGFDGLDQFDIGISEGNFLGIGHEFRNDFLYDVDNTPVVGYGASYAINNIKRSFINAEVSFLNSEPFSQSGIVINKDFITPEIKYAGGIEVSREERETFRFFPDTTLTFFVKFNFQDAWIGRSFVLKESQSSRVNLQFAISASRTRFLNRPRVDADTNQTFFDRNIYLFSAAIAKRGYERSSLISGFGRTEDIPRGYIVEALVGRDINEFSSRTYLAGITSFGDYVGRLGYLRPSFSFSGFIESGRVEQADIKFDINYFSYLYRVRKINFRQFLRLRYTAGFRRYADEFVNINDDNGVRGLRDTFLRGTRKISFNAETVAFTPIFFAGFRLAIFGFADLALVNSESAKLLSNTLYQGYGLGFRFRNENLTFNTFQLRFAWYPRTPNDISNFGIDLTGQTGFSTPDFTTQKPEIANFQ